MSVSVFDWQDIAALSLLKEQHALMFFHPLFLSFVAICPITNSTRRLAKHCGRAKHRALLHSKNVEKVNKRNENKNVASRNCSQ
jgi:hypothetical protein